jgi:protein-disulfide isomerase
MSRLTVPVSDADHAEGPAGAPITLVEYGDYQCPSCGAAYPVVKDLQQQLGKKLRFVFRNFPLENVHEHAMNAALAAEAAGALGGEKAFWKMHDTLFENQNALDDADLGSYAADAGVDGNEVMRAVETGAHAERVRADLVGGARSGVNGTPTFFVNGERYDGDWTDADEFAAALGHA